MTVAISPTPNAEAAALRDVNALDTGSSRPFDLTTPAQPDDPNSFAEAFGAALWRENTVASASRWVNDKWDGSGDQNPYNPYAALKQQFPKDTLDQLKSAISDGSFDDVHSDGELQDRVKDQLDRQKATNGWGYFAGSVAASLLDPTSYIPVAGEDALAARFGRIGVGAAHAMLSTASSEAILRATQNDRTLGESLMNIGTAGVIGGGFGIFSSAFHPRSPMHPENPDNIFRPENLHRDGEISRDMTGKQDELSGEELRSLNENYVAAGAAPLIDNYPSIARVQPKTALGQKIAAVTEKVGDVLNSVTIKGQVLRATSGRARWAGVRIFDPAGIIFEHNLKGIGNSPSATMLKEHYMSEYEALNSQMAAETRQVSAETDKRVDYGDALLLTQRQLYSMDDPKTVQKMVQKYGAEDYGKIHELAGRLADTIHQFNATWEGRLTKAGIMQDPQEVARLSGELRATRDRLEQVKSPPGDEGAPESLAAREAETKDLRAKRDDLVSKLRQETVKPSPLGKDYGHAQVWNRDHVFAAPSEFKSWLHDVLAVTPDEDWLLDQHSMTKEEFNGLSPEEARPIREDWAGDSYHWKVDQLTHRVEGLNQTLKEQKLDLAEGLRWFGALDKRETNLTLSEARKKRDAIWGQRVAKRDPKFSERADELDALLRKVEDTHADLKASEKELKDGLAEAKAARAATEADLRKTGKALKKARKATPLNEMIEQVYANLSDRGSTPQGILDRILETSDREVGRVKKRGLNLSREQRAYAIQRGWLRDDLSNILRMQTDQLASELSLREALDIGKGKTFSSWSDLLDWIDRDYQDRIEAAGDQKTKDALTAEMKKTVDNLVLARDRLKGGVHIDDGTANGWLGWATTKMKQANMIRYGSGFTLASLTDTASVALRHGSVARLLTRYSGRAIKIMRTAAHEDMTRFRSMIASVEIGMGAHAAARRFGTEDALNGHMYGYGIGHGNIRKFTGAVDKGAEWLSDVGIKMGGLPVWNTFWKTVVGLDMLDRLHAMSIGYEKLSPAEQADLATLGIGRAEAQRLGGFMSKYAEKGADGGLDPHFEKWEGEAGQSAARDAELAIMRDMNRAINTPDVGDTPRLMSTHLGSLLLSFQTFAFTFMNQYAYPLAQRLALFHEKQAYMSLGILLGAATMVIVGKDIINGRDPSERFKPENAVRTSYDIVDRSGLLGFLSPYADAGLKMTPLGGGTRYSRNNSLQSVLGINAGLVGDVGNAIAAVTSGDPHAARKVLTLAPFNTQARLLNRIFDHNP